MAKILIIEDDSMMARVYEKAFRFDQHEVELAGNGVQGLEKINENKPDLILLDLMMPKMDGLEFLDKIKANPKTKNIPVVVLTNLADEDAAQQALSRGAVKFIVKSEQTPQKAVKIIDEILAGYTRNEIPKTKE